MIHNTDDHLRNHGFFIDVLGVRPSPAYDMNPSGDRTELSLAINEVDTECYLSIAMNAHKDYVLSAQQAEHVRREVQTAAATWREEANRLQISKAEQDRRAAAFEHS
jgi:serine/threonine-protein kinase HipA